MADKDILAAMDRDVAARRQDMARANMAGAYNVSPADAVTAFKTAPITTIPPSAGMIDAQEQRRLADQQTTNDVLANSPSLQKFAGRSPAHVAATQHEWPSLAKIASKIDDVNSLMTKDFFDVIAQRSDAFDASFRALDRQGPTMTGRGELMQERFGNVLLAGAGAALSAFEGVANSLYARPMSYIPTYKLVGNAWVPRTQEENQAFYRENFMLALGGLGAGRIAFPGGPKPLRLKGPPEPAAAPGAAPPPPRPRGPAEPRPQGKRPEDYATYTLDYKPAPIVPQELSPPGLGSRDNALWAAHAEATTLALADLQELIAGTQTYAQLPELTKEFLEDAAPNQVVTLYPEFSDAFYEIADDLGMTEDEVAFMQKVDQATLQGGTIQIPLAEYLAVSAGKPWAEMANQYVAFGDGVPAARIKEFAKASEAALIEPLSNFGGYTGPKPGGSNPGAIYGDEWLIKGDAGASYKTLGEIEERARNEALAASLLNAAMPGLAPEMRLVDLGSQFGGGTGVASKLIPNLTPLDKNNPLHVKNVQKTFLLQAWLANHDAIGLEFDNTMIDQAGGAVHIDPGGAMLYRATGKPKPSFGEVPSEFDSMRDPNIAPQAAAIFGSMTDDDLWEAAKPLAKISDEKIEKLANKFGLPQLAKTLIERKNALLVMAIDNFELAKAEGMAGSPVDPAHEEDGDTEAAEKKAFDEFWMENDAAYEPSFTPEDLEVLDDFQREQLEKIKPAVKAAIKQVVQDHYLDLFFKDQKALAMPKPLYVAYSKKVKTAFDALVKKMWEKTYNDVKKQYTKEWRDAYHRNFSAILEGQMRQPVMYAAHEMRYSKEEEDALRKDNALVDDKGEPITFYHGSEHWNIGTPENPEFKVSQSWGVISFAYNPQFAINWRNMDDFDRLRIMTDWELRQWQSRYEEGKALTVLITNLHAKNPADFRKEEDVRKAARWHAERDYMVRDWDASSPITQAQYLLQMGILEPLGDDSKEKLTRKIAEREAKGLRLGKWRMWEKPSMWKEFGWDAAHMKENDSSPYINICVADPDQVYWRYSVDNVTRKAWKLSLEVKKQYDANLWSALPNVYFEKGGYTADELAQKFGFNSGVEMLAKLSEMEIARGKMGFKKYVQQLAVNTARDVTIAEVGDLSNPDKILADAKAIFAAPEASSILIDDFKTLSQSIGAPIDVATIKENIKTRFDRLPVKDAIKIKHFEKEVKWWGDKAELAMAKAKPDFITAFTAKQRQLESFFQLEMAHFLIKNLASAERKFKYWAKETTITGMAQPFLDQIHNYLPKWGYPTKRNRFELAEALGGVSIEEFVATVTAINSNFPIVPGVDPADLRDLKVEDYYTVSRFIKALGRFGRTMNGLWIDGRRRDFNLQVNTAVAIAPTGKAPPPVDTSRKLSAGEQIIKYGSRYDALHRKATDFVEWFDRGDPLGIFAQVFTHPMSEASDLEGKLRRDVYGKVLDAWDEIPVDLKKSYNNKLVHPLTLPPTVSPDGTVTPSQQELVIRRDQIVMLALYTGTAEGLTKAAGGYGVEPEELLDFINQDITPEEAELVSTIWGMFAELAPKVSSTLRFMTGEGLRYREPTPVTLAGKEYAGGYWPIHYETAEGLNKTVRDFEREKENEIGPDAVEQHFGDVMPNKGFSEQVTNYIGPVKLDLNSITRAFDSHIRYVSYAIPIHQARKFFYDERIQTIIKRSFGEEYLKIIPDWLNGIVLDHAPPEGTRRIVEATARWVRRSMGTAILLGSWTTLVSQAAGAANGIAALSDGNPTKGAAYMAKGYHRFYRRLLDVDFEKWGEPGFFRGLHEMFELTEMMRQRYSNIDANLVEALSEIRELDPSELGLKKNTRKVANGLRAFIGLVEMMTASGPIWEGAMIKAQNEGMTDANALRYANRMVIKSQGSGRRVDLAAVQRGSEVEKLFYLFQSYFNQQYQWMIDLWRHGIGGGGPPNLPPPPEAMDAEMGPDGVFNVNVKNNYKRSQMIIILIAVFVMGGVVLANLFTGRKTKPTDFLFIFARPMLGLNDFAQAIDRHLEIDEDGNLDVVRTGDSSFSTSAFNRLGDAAEKILLLGLGQYENLTKGERNKLRKPFQTLAGAGLFVPIPATQGFGRAAEYLWELETGEQTPRDEFMGQRYIDIFSGLTRGPQKEQASKGSGRRGGARSGGKRGSSR